MQIALLSRTFPGETRNGDGYLAAALDQNWSFLRLAVSDETEGDAQAVVPLEDAAYALVALFDGVGHGPEAAEATRVVQRVVRDRVPGNLVTLIRACHSAAARTRGAVISLLRIDLGRRRLEHLGVGNIAVRIHAEPTGVAPDRSEGRASLPGGDATVSRTFVSSPGIVGYNLPQNLIRTTCAYTPGETVVMHTDGIRPNYRVQQLTAPETSPQAVARSILADCALTTDDATVAVLK